MSSTAIWERVTVDAVRWAPKGLLSAAVGWGSRRSLPRWVRPPIYRLFGWVSGARLDEAELPLAEYASLGEFFARRLRDGARPIAADARTVTSPCDGVVAVRGVADQGRMIQAKGHAYSLAELLADEELAARLVASPYLTIYLAPRDYHRVHAPMSAELIGYDYIPGTFFPVKPPYSDLVDRIMTRNERVVFHLVTASGQAIALVMVGAFGVSNIEIAADGERTGVLRRARAPRKVRFRRPIAVERGDELGAFRLGSTVITVFEPGLLDFEDIDAGQAVRFGEPVGRSRKHADGASSGEIVS